MNTSTPATGTTTGTGTQAEDATGTTATEEGRAVVQAYMDTLMTGDIAALKDFFTEDRPGPSPVTCRSRAPGPDRPRSSTSSCPR
ncbi:ketosteroid isomerase family protein [Actinacidiphila acidipaludis]|uniref:ketosteroid isomerase family protein n=1 Tax=Actinacidiphila acidipaludis TaxID=2873382 RepID=UPI00223B2541|nr:ketosteroid isomerase family protein [Streptomyces acidipaludis]